MQSDTPLQWTESLPEAFQIYRGDSRIDEVECIVPDLVGVSRGKAMPAHKFNPNQTFYLPVSLFSQTITGEYVDLGEVSVTEPDMVLRPDMATASAVPWASTVTLQVINDLLSRDGEPIALAPRNVLKRVLSLYAERGWRAVIAPELEFYLTKANVDPNEPIEPPIGRTGRPGAGRQVYSMAAVDEHGPVVDTIYDFAEDQGLMIDTVIQEGGAGQMEINLLHGDPLDLADQVFYFKRAIREAALKHGIFATFMAKPMRDQPGSAMHVHQSVVDAATGESIFSNADGPPSPQFFHYIGGSQRHLMQVVPILAPYVNSYRRLRGHQSAPTNLDWAEDNRSTGLRVPHGSPAARRIENRVIGIDANPYISIAASLACGYLGMINSIDPRDPVTGNAFDPGSELPMSLDDALELFADASEIRSVLGEEFCALYEQIKRTELQEFHAEVSTWERQHLLLNV